MAQQWVLKRGFDRVFAARRSIAKRTLAVNWVAVPGAPTRVGISVARRVGNAVRRNRVKRRLRAIIAELVVRIVPGRAVVIVARQGAAEASFADLQQGVQELLVRAGILSGEEGADNGTKSGHSRSHLGN